MRLYCVLLRGGVLAALASLTVACNAVLGVNDVSLVTPDAHPSADAAPDTPSCKVDAHVQLVATGSSPSSLIHLTTGEPSLLIFINADPKPDGLFVQLYNNMGQHGVLNTPGTYQLTAADTTPATCGICAFIDVNIDRTAGTSEQTYFAKGMGDLTLTTASTTRLTGSMHNLELRHIDTTSGTDASDGCVVKIDTVEFDLPYSAAAR
jgi:hypothetical protein